MTDKKQFPATDNTLKTEKGVSIMNRIIGFFKLIAIVLVSFAAYSFFTGTAPSRSKYPVKTTVTPVFDDRSCNGQIGQEVCNALDKAYANAERYANREIQSWSNEVRARANDEFFRDYFSLLNSYQREINYVINNILNAINSQHANGAEKEVLKLEELIEQSVIKKEISQRKIENIMTQTVNIYAETLDDELRRIQVAYNIPAPDWNKYICEVASMTASVGYEKNNISFKTMVSTGMIGGCLIVKPGLEKIAKKASSVVAEKIAARTGIKVAEKAIVKSGSKAAEKITAKTLAKSIPVIGYGIFAATFVWDIIDHKVTAEEGKRVLKTNLNEYMDEVEKELMNTNSDNVMGCLLEFQNRVKAEIAKK